MYVTNGVKAEYSVLQYLKYAEKMGEISFVNIGNRNLYNLYLKSKNTSANFLKNHNSIHKNLTAFAEETLVTVNGHQVRRSKINVDMIPYSELQDHLLGDFVFLHNKTKQLIIVDVTTLRGNNDFTKQILHKKSIKMKKRCYLYKSLAAKVTGKGSQYLSIIWNECADDDLLEFIEESHLKNKFLRRTYNNLVISKGNVADVLFNIHVKTNIN